MKLKSVIGTTHKGQYEYFFADDVRTLVKPLALELEDLQTLIVFDKGKDAIRFDKVILELHKIWQGELSKE